MTFETFKAEVRGHKSDIEWVFQEQALSFIAESPGGKVVVEYWATIGVSNPWGVTLEGMPEASGSTISYAFAAAAFAIREVVRLGAELGLDVTP